MTQHDVRIDSSHNVKMSLVIRGIIIATRYDALKPRPDELLITKRRIPSQHIFQTETFYPPDLQVMGDSSLMKYVLSYFS